MPTACGVARMVDPPCKEMFCTEDMGHDSEAVITTTTTTTAIKATSTVQRSTNSQEIASMSVATVSLTSGSTQVTSGKQVINKAENDHVSEKDIGEEQRKMAIYKGIFKSLKAQEEFCTLHNISCSNLPVLEEELRNDHIEHGENEELASKYFINSVAQAYMCDHFGACEEDEIEDGTLSNSAVSKSTEMKKAAIGIGITVGVIILAGATAGTIWFIRRREAGDYYPGIEMQPLNS